MKPAILTDITRCVGCGACALACKEINELPVDDDPSRLSATTWTTVEKRRGWNVRRQCMHCLEPSCVSACPVAALHKSTAGPVVYDESRCIGCRYCMIACPFQVPRYTWNDPQPRVQKCIMCFEKRVSEGRQPACTAACPTGATRFGDREELIHEARGRILDHPGRYVDRIYGTSEAGGTSVLYLAPIPFEELGFQVKAGTHPYPELTWAVLSKIPNVVTIGGVGLFGIWWLFRRKVELAEEEHARRAPLSSGEHGQLQSGGER